MTTGKEEQVEQPPVEPVVEPVVETQAITFTQEQEDKMNEMFDEKYKTIQRTINRKDEEIRTLKTQPQPSKAMATMVSEIEKLSQANPDSDPASQARIAALRQELQTEEDRAYQETTIRQNEERLNQLIVNAGHDPTDDKFEPVWDAFSVDSIDGKFTRADRKLQKILNTVEPQKVEVKVETEKNIEDEVQKRLRVEMANRNMLDSEITTPSGGTSNREQIIEDFIKNPDDPKIKTRYYELRNSENR